MYHPAGTGALLVGGVGTPPPQDTHARAHTHAHTRAHTYKQVHTCAHTCTPAQCIHTCMHMGTHAHTLELAPEPNFRGPSCLLKKARKWAFSVHRFLFQLVKTNPFESQLREASSGCPRAGLLYGATCWPSWSWGRADSVILVF